MTRGRGKKPLLVAPGRSHEKLLGAATPRTGDLPPDSLANDSAPLPLKDQTVTPWCTGYTMSEVLEYALYGQTGLVQILSAMYAYVGGKLVENFIAGLAATAPINDDGADFGNLILSVQGQGTCLDALMPANQSLLQAKENYMQIRDGMTRKQKPAEFGAINASDDQGYINALCQSLLPYPDGKTGRAVPIGIASSYPDFDNATGSTILVAPPAGLLPTDGSAIDHEVELTVYATVLAVSGSQVTLSNGKTFSDPSGTIRVDDFCMRVKNHWGIGWSPLSDIPGTVWVHQSFMTAQRALGGDAQAINVEVSS